MKRMQNRRRWAAALAGAIAVGLVGGAGLVSSPAFASGQPANPYAGLPPMTAWYWGNPGGNSPEVVFDFGGNFEAFPFPNGNAIGTPSSGYGSIDQNWGGIDNPAPLEWYYNNVSKTDLGDSVFGAGVQYSATLVSKMEAENFAPSLVGGVNPSGMTGGSTGSTSTSSSATSSSTPPSPAPSSTAPATTTPSASTSSTTAASSATGTPPSSSTAQAAPTASSSPSASSSGPSRAPSSAGSATSKTPLEPPGLKQETPPKVAQKILRHDEALVADAHHPTRPASHTPWIAWGGGVVALLVITGGGVVWWRKRTG